MATVTTKIVQIGNSLGVILPKGAAESSNLDKGDQVTITYSQGVITISPYDEKVQEDLELARGIAKRYRNTLRELSQ